MNVRYDIGNWLIEDEEGNQAVAIIKDIDKFCADLNHLLIQKRISGWRDGVETLLGNLEYALVSVQKNGTVRWQGGKFVE